MYTIKTYNAISSVGLDTFCTDKYSVTSTTEQPHAYLLRSHQLHDEAFPHTLEAVARAGAGVNNIPVDHLSEQGIPVFNTPGANANAVKELVIAAMLLASRNICHAWQFVQQLTGDESQLQQQVEQGKKRFSGSELPGKTVAVIGLGAIGVQVANAASQLGMQVIGYDPMITIERAWELSADVQQADDLNAAIQAADFITVHVPLLDQTRNLMNADRIKQMKPGAILLNFARQAIVDQQAVLAALAENKLRYYVCDFPTAPLIDHPAVVALPHLGASTGEAEENCAVMAARQLMAYLEHGCISNSVNFPAVNMSRSKGVRLTVSNCNIPNIVGQISTALAAVNLNIVDMINKSRDDLAYTLVDVNDLIPQQVLEQIKAIDGVLRVRVLE